MNIANQSATPIAFSLMRADGTIRNLMTGAWEVATATPTSQQYQAFTSTLPGLWSSIRLASIPGTNGLDLADDAKLFGCFKFSGHDYHLISRPDLCVTPSKVFTWAAWFRAPSAAADSTLICEGSSTTNNPLFRVYINDLDVRTMAISWRSDNGTDTTVRGVIHVNDGAWHHVAATCDGTTLAMYVDGNSDGTASLAASVAALSDGGFEAPVVSSSSFQYAPTGTPWTFSGGSGVSANGSAFTSSNPNSPEGSQVAFLQDTGSVSQSVTGWSAGNYVLTFQAAQRSSPLGHQDFRVLVDGTPVGSFTPSGTSYQSYSTAAFAVTAGAHAIAFQGLNSASGDNTAFIDNIQLTQTSSAASAINQIAFGSMARTTIDRFLAGDVADIRCYPRALSAASVASAAKRWITGPTGGGDVYAVTWNLMSGVPSSVVSVIPVNWLTPDSILPGGCN